MAKLILLNGPKGCGKSKAVAHLLQQGLPLVERQCKDRLHTLTQFVFGVDPDTYFEIYEDRNQKEKPNALFKASPAMTTIMSSQYGVTPHPDGWLSIRSAMIVISEMMIKPLFGRDYFGQFRVDSMTSDEIAIDDSTGFKEELIPAIDKLGQENILLIRIYGRGESSEDSRQMIKDDVIENTVDIYNTVSEAAFLDRVSNAVQLFLEPENALSSAPNF